MGKSLVIVESPGKVHTINAILGSKYIVKSSIGHVRDLPAAGTGARGRTAGLSKDQKLFQRMGIDPEHGWIPTYEILPGKEDVVNDLKKAAAKADYVYLATDLDREGEAIAWHLKEVLELPDDKARRVVFNEITKKAILESFEHPGNLDMSMVNAQQTRRFLDRVVGFMVSPLLWEKVGRGLSAGRVQSVAVRLIVEKEKKIKAFVPEEYWKVTASLSSAAGDVVCDVRSFQGKEFRPVSESETREHLERLKAANPAVSDVISKSGKVAPPPPFTTASLQQNASSRLGFSVKKTMRLAQDLYEAGMSTYMRTVSARLSEYDLTAIRGHIQGAYGKDYMLASTRVFAAGDKAQDAHEAIRPTDIAREDPAGVDADARRLYELIRNRTLACQMPDAEVVSSELEIAAGEYVLSLKGKTVKFDGWMKVAGYSRDVLIPNLKKGDALTLQELTPAQHFTRPEPRYTEATLVKELEKRGIGRPSTYATIISTIQDRGYVKLEQRRFFAEKMGEIVTYRLGKSFPDLIDYDFTSGMERNLDDIAESRLDWIKCLDDFYRGFHQELDKAREPAEDGGMENNISVETSVMCPDCGKPMLIKNAATGVFLACSSYSGKTGRKKDESCRKTMNLVPENQLPMFSDEESESRFLRTKKRCPICQAVMDSYIIDEKRKIHICSNNPNCAGYLLETGEFKLKGHDGPEIQCERCGSKMELRTGRFGSYMACTNAECGNTRKILKSGEIAPPKERPVDMPDLICSDGKSHFVLRDGAAGIFLASSAFPKVRETRPPLVAELRKYRDLLPEKFLYLADAPETDPDGNMVTVRFSRKLKTQYVHGETPEGKPTGFVAWYRDGKWEAETPARKSAAKKTAAGKAGKDGDKAAPKKSAAKKSRKTAADAG